VLLNALRISGEAGQTKLILLAIEDITGRRSPGPTDQPEKETLSCQWRRRHERILPLYLLQLSAAFEN
jgi:hypothetical protein